MNKISSEDIGIGTGTIIRIKNSIWNQIEKTDWDNHAVILEEETPSFLKLSLGSISNCPKYTDIIQNALSEYSYLKMGLSNDGEYRFSKEQLKLLNLAPANKIDFDEKSIIIRRKCWYD